jgi:hypothetical protein
MTFGDIVIGQTVWLSNQLTSDGELIHGKVQSKSTTHDTLGIRSKIVVLVENIPADSRFSQEYVWSTPEEALKAIIKQNGFTLVGTLRSYDE